MPTRLLVISTVIFLACMATVLYFNVRPHILPHADESYLHLNDIEGMAIIYKGVEYTLNFEQQNEIALLLNNSKILSQGLKDLSIELPFFDKIVIYQFNQTTLDVSPVGFINNNLIYSVPQWSNGSVLKDTSNGSLKHLLMNSYDA